jgi:hypothetical protein
MRRSLNIFMRVVCALTILVFIVGFFVEPLLLSTYRRVDVVGWRSAGLAIVYMVPAAWALLAYRKAEGQTKRLLFGSIVALAILVFITAVLGRLHPQFASVLHHPVDTVLGYLFGVLVALALVLDARRRDTR